MRLEKTVQINDKSFILRELTVRDFVNLFPQWKEMAENFSLVDILKLSKDVLIKITTLTQDDILDFSFSELDMLEKEFREINSAFLKRSTQVKVFADSLGIKEILGQISNAIKEDVMERIKRAPSVVAVS